MGIPTLFYQIKRLPCALGVFLFFSLRDCTPLIIASRWGCKGSKASSHFVGPSTFYVRNSVTTLLRSSRDRSIHNSGLSPYIIHTVHSESKKVPPCKHGETFLFSSLFLAIRHPPTSWAPPYYILHHSAHAGTCWHCWNIFFDVSYY